MTASLALASARAEYDAALLALWDAQSDLLDALARRNGADAEFCRALIVRVRGWLASALDARDAAFDAVAAARSAASPLRLVPRELTGDEAAALAVAERGVADVRVALDRAVAAHWLSQAWLLDSIGDASIGDAEEWRIIVANDALTVSRVRDRVFAALAARAPLLAARWQEASP